MFDAVLAQVKSNPRLRIGLWLVIAILWVYGILVLGELRDANLEDYQRLELRARRAAQDASQQGWIEKAEQFRTLRVQLESQVWQAASASLARATYQDWLSRAFNDAGVTRLQTSVTLVDERAPGAAETAGARTDAAGDSSRKPRDLWQIRTKAVFDFTPASLLKILTLLAENDRKNVIEAVVVRKDAVPRVELTLSAFFQRNEAAPALANPPSRQQGKL